MLLNKFLIGIGGFLLLGDVVIGGGFWFSFWLVLLLLRDVLILMFGGIEEE